MRGVPIRSTALACGLVLLTAACSPPPPPRIAFVGSSRASRGAELAVRAVQASGGIHGRQLRLSVLYDDGGSGTRAIASAEALAADRAILAVVGHAGSTTSLAAAQTYNQAHLPQLAPTTSAPVFALAGPYSFRLMPSDENQADFLARQVPPRSRVGIVYLNTDYGRGLRRALNASLALRGLAPVLEWSFNAPLDTLQIAVLLSEVAAGRPDLLLWVGPPRWLALVLPSVRRDRAGLVVYGSEAVDADETYSTLHAALVGVRFVRFIDPENPGRRIQDLRAKYRAAAGMELTYDVVFAYDAVGLLAQALRDGARTREDLREYLMSLGRSRPPYPGVGGPIAFDSTRTALRPYNLAEVTAAGVKPLSRP